MPEFELVVVVMIVGDTKVPMELDTSRESLRITRSVHTHRILTVFFGRGVRLKFPFFLHLLHYFVQQKI